jgi:mannose-1-phosphate guanylyltransferase
MGDSEKRTRVGVIMAGGSGERFWPVSRRLRPKQLLKLTRADITMLAEAVERISPLIPPDHIYVITGTHLVEPIRKGNIGIPNENVLAEPDKRNTAGALTYAAATLLARYNCGPEKLSMAVTTADHRIAQPERFLACVEVALDTAETLDVLATMGVTPTRPETGYGYIQAQEVISRTEAVGGPITAYEVAAFHEKPNQQVAEDFIATGEFYWNSGMFFWTLDAFVRELKQAKPNHHRALLAMTEALRQKDQDKAAKLFAGLEDISIDFALMERAKRVCMIEADFPWDDVGSWTSLDRTHAADENGNVSVGEPVLIDTRDCIVFNDAGEASTAVGVIGAQDLVVVVTEDAVLVMPKDRAQDVRKVVEALKKRGAPQL